MALQQVNVGAIPNDGTGDDPRTGISKVNANMVLLEATGVNGTDNVFTEVNLNKLDFGGDDTNSVIAWGHAQNSTAVLLTLPLNFILEPASITITSTFSIRSSNFSVVQSGLTVSELTLDASKGNRVALVTVALTGPISITEPVYYLTQDTGTSKITVNV